MTTQSTLTFAVGDVHGELEKLMALVLYCRARAGQRPFRFVFLGDYVDRGPDSCGVVEMLMAGQQTFPDMIICLRGNHEELLIERALNAAVPIHQFGLIQTLR